MKKDLKKLMVRWAIIGAIIGILVAEFVPGLVGGGGESLSGVFSSYRNELAIRYGLGAAVLGALAAFIKLRVLK